MQEITLKGKNYLLVEVPGGLMQINVFDTCYSYYVLTDEMERVIDFEEMESEKELIGVLYDILKDEDICKELVESHTYKTPNKWGKELIMWKDYNFQLNEEELFDFDFARQAFMSYLQSINLDLTKNWTLIKII